jgi:GMP synthase (glutamine-hydrolysing)
MLHWHGDTFDLPEGAQLLASRDDYTNQIYAVGQHVLAFQCHPELNPHAFEHWPSGDV